jgi:hypothetical protein
MCVKLLKDMGKIGSGGRDRTADLGVMNRHPGNNVSYCPLKSCSHQRFSGILHSFPSRTVLYTSRAVFFGHKLDTANWVFGGVDS